MTKNERIQFRISKKNKDFIREQCANDNITISQFMTNLLSTKYNNLKEK